MIKKKKYKHNDCSIRGVEAKFYWGSKRSKDDILLKDWGHFQKRNDLKGGCGNVTNLAHGRGVGEGLFSKL